MINSESRLKRSLRIGWAATLGIGSICAVLLACIAWLAPELLENWLIDSTSPDVFAQFESVGKAEALLWLSTWVAPCVALVCRALWNRRGSLLPVVEGACWCFWRVTANADSIPSGLFSGVVPLLKRSAIIGSFILAMEHGGAAIGQRLHDWPYFRFNAGDLVLPNISDSNREVIRYLRTMTPENARILVVSDQKLFFLSYYLRPRSLYHRMHPTAEHLIPRANQARQLAAYRLEELPADVWDCQPDFVLEYFEGAEFVDPARLTEDGDWLGFMRQRTGDQSHVPGYVVVLRRRPFTEGQP